MKMIVLNCKLSLMTLLQKYVFVFFRLSYLIFLFKVEQVSSEEFWEQAQELENEEKEMENERKRLIDDNDLDQEKQEGEGEGKKIKLENPEDK